MNISELELMKEVRISYEQSTDEEGELLNINYIPLKDIRPDHVIITINDSE